MNHPTVSLDVIHHILSFLSPCEIVRLRQVSKKFRDLTYSHALWKQIYGDARFPRPPGPFSWQSTRYLERTLVQSELVSKTWTSQPPEVLSETSTDCEGNLQWTVVLGRWCIFKNGHRLQYHDIDSDTYHFLYEDPSDWYIVHMASTADINGHWLCLLVFHTGHQERELRLLAFRVDSDGFSEPEIIGRTPYIQSQFILDPWQRSANSFHGSTPFITVRRDHPRLIYDLRTRCLYKLPISSNLVNQPQVRLADTWYNILTLTKTHVISVRMYTRMYTSGPSEDAPVLIQAFIVPDSAIPHDVGELRLTHEAILDTYYLRHSGLLRNSIVDPVTGSVNIRLLHATDPASQQSHSMMCLDLTLPKPVSNTDVLPITIRSQNLFEISTRDLELYTVSDDGHARGLLLTAEGIFDSSFFNSVRGFTVDASREECTNAVSDPGPFELVVEDPEDIAFDGIRGRFHYIQTEVQLTDDHLVTLNLA